MSEHAPYLPRYSDPKDIEDFVTQLEAFEQSRISPENFRTFRLQRGVYGQRQSDVQMIRVKIPYGLVGAAQLEALAMWPTATPTASATSPPARTCSFTSCK